MHCHLIIFLSMLTFDLVHLRCEFRHQFLYCGHSWGCWGKNNPGAIKAHIRGKCYGVPITPAVSKICLHWGGEPFSSLVVGSSVPCLFQFPTVVSFSRANKQSTIALSVKSDKILGSKQCFVASVVHLDQHRNTIIYIFWKSKRDQHKKNIRHISWTS